MQILLLIKKNLLFFFPQICDVFKSRCYLLTGFKPDFLKNIEVFTFNYKTQTHSFEKQIKVKF